MARHRGGMRGSQAAHDIGQREWHQGRPWEADDADRGKGMGDGRTSALCCSCMASWPDIWLASWAATWGFICSAKLGCAARADKFPCTMKICLSSACVQPVSVHHWNSMQKETNSH